MQRCPPLGALRSLAGTAVFLHTQINPDVLRMAWFLDDGAFATEASEDVSYMTTGPIMPIIAANGSRYRLCGPETECSTEVRQLSISDPPERRRS